MVAATGLGIPLTNLLSGGVCGGNQAWAADPATKQANDSLRDRIAGMLIGSLIGDAAGGPIEFKTHEELSQHDTSIKRWAAEEVLDDDSLRDRATAFELIPYDKIRPDTHSYGPWTKNGPAGMLTDDSRMKIILLCHSAGRSGWQASCHSQDLRPSDDRLRP